MDGALNMTDHNKTNSGQQSQILLADKFANPEADRYLGLLEARKKSLETDIASARATEGIPDYARITRLQESLKVITENLGVALAHQAVFQKALIFETVEEAMEKMTEKEGRAYFEHLANLRDRRVTKSPSSGETFVGFVKKLFF